MLKKIILDHVLPIGIVVIGVLVGIFFMGKTGLFSGGQVAPPTEIRTVDTPEYKALDSAYQEQGRKVAYMMGKLAGMEEAYGDLEAKKKQEPVILKKKEQEYQAKPNDEKESEFWQKYNEMWGDK